MLCPPVGQPPGIFDLAAPHTFSWFTLLVMGALLMISILGMLIALQPLRLIPPLPGRRALLWLRAGRIAIGLVAALFAGFDIFWLNAIEAWQNLALAQGCPELLVTDAWFLGVKGASVGLTGVLGFIPILLWPLEFFFRKKAQAMPGVNIGHQEYSVLIRRPAEIVFAAAANPEENRGWVMYTRNAQAWRVPEGPLGVGTIIESKGESRSWWLKARVEITEYEPDRLITLKLLSYKHPHPKAPDLQAMFSYRVEPVAEGSKLASIIDAGLSTPCSLWQQMEQPPEAIASSLIRGIGKKYLATLKKTVEKG